MAMSSSSPRVFLKKYDVFISFRGVDTRDNFTPDLYSAMEKENIIAYIDNQLERGDDIWPGLVKAIKDSMIAVVVFSERYATSKWCLKELALIMECRRLGELAVIPVFYKTIPTDVRKQSGSYKKPFEDYAKTEDQDKVPSWRDALTKAANISGYESSAHGDDSQVIDNIVKHIGRKLRSMQCVYQDGLIGIEEQCGAIEGFSGKFGRVGLWGMGGTGKTTIAKALFAYHFPQYDSVCFLQNVREESKMHGLTHIRDKLLSELLKEQVTTSNFSGCSLSSRKVLIVLDDVSSSEQLEALFVGLGELGEGSSLIVTTRDRHLLHRIVDEIHEFKPWDTEKSLVLFSLGAFKKSKPDIAFEDLSRRAVKCAAGLPIVLKFLGSYFYSNDLKFWESELRDLEERKNTYIWKKTLKEILDLFQVSYDGLSRQEQAIFLDIAFFFKDRNQDSVISILDACGFDAASGIQRLKDKALITISKTNTIQMLDFLQYMAFDIVENDETGPRRGTLLRDDALRSLDCSNEGTLRVVEGAVLDLSLDESYEFNLGMFCLPKLRILKFYVPAGKKLSTSISLNTNLFNLEDNAELKYFEWTGYPMTCVPFCVNFLVEIRIPYSHVQELWEETEELVNLELLDLSECRLLERLPNLSKASKLKWVYLSGCEVLRKLHPSLLSMETLVTLTLDRCKKLTSIKSEKHLRYLEELNANGCSRLKEFSVLADSIKRLDLSKTIVKKLYPSIGHLSKLVVLNVEGLWLQNLPDEISCLTCLEELRISNCETVDKEKLHVICACLRSLKVLHLKDCDELIELPNNISVLSSLRELSLDGSIVEQLPTDIKLLEKLEILSLAKCWNLDYLPELPLLLKELNAGGCTSLVTASIKTFSVKMNGMEKHISFMDARELNESSLLQITEDAMFAMMRAQLGVFVRSSFSICLPGSSVPLSSGSGQGLLAYRSTTGSSITIKPHDRRLSNWLGTIYSVVLSSNPGTTMNAAKIQCRIYGKYGESNTCYGKDIMVCESDNVYLWHGSSFKGAQDFKFFIEGKYADRIQIKECGVHLICCSNSELESFRGEAELEPELEVEELQSALDMRVHHINLWEAENNLQAGPDYRITVIGDDDDDDDY